GGRAPARGGPGRPPPTGGRYQGGRGGPPPPPADRRDRGAALLLVTHNLGEGLALASHAAVMRRGRFVRHDARATLDVAAYATEYRELATADA
ncbi:MAG: hypothetical protein LH467_11435, partial [Gemmatimonadaceae bacterium]|nr:hypothetical protein [Gemmatimonadaceae bacterium]